MTHLGKMVSAFCIVFWVMACSAEGDTRNSSDNAAGDDGSGGTDGNSFDDTEFDNWDGGDRALSGCESMDILFVIDDSESMVEEQLSLSASFPAFIKVLDTYRTPAGDPVDYHVGVTTTGVSRKYREKAGFMSTPVDTSSMGRVSDGVLQGLGREGCTQTEAWMSGPSNLVATQFGCAASVGTNGVHVEMPFAAIEEALGTQSEPGQPNEGFYRTGGDSLLVVIVITDEDDCSIRGGGVMQLDDNAHTCVEKGSKGLHTADETKAFLDEKTGGTGRYVVVVIAGPGPDKKCHSDYGDADYADRIEGFTDAIGSDFSLFGDICQGNLAQNLEDALELMTLTCDHLPPPV